MLNFLQLGLHAFNTHVHHVRMMHSLRSYLDRHLHIHGSQHACSLIKVKVKVSSLVALFDSTLQNTQTLLCTSLQHWQ